MRYIVDLYPKYYHISGYVTMVQALPSLGPDRRV